MKLSIILLSIFTVATAEPAEFVVHDADELSESIKNLEPGDAVVMADGVWTDQELVFVGRGTQADPITLRPQTPGGVTLTGESNLSISGTYLVVDGLQFVGGGPGDLSHVVQFRGPLGDATRCRLTNTLIKDYNPDDPATRYFWVSLYGQHNRVDHNRFQNHNHSGVTVVAWLDGEPAHHRIDHNHFLDRAPGEGNGYETMRFGTSEVSDTNAHILVESNLFERCDGEIEIISNKSNDNVFRNNTFSDCAGTLTLRHGHRATVEGNFFLGEGKARSGGIRVIGEDHQIVNNYIADVDDRADGAISIVAGIKNTQPNGYQQVKNALIAHNTIVNVKGAAISLDWGYGQRNRTLLPENVTIANNLISSTAAPLFEGQEGQGWRWQNNLVHGTTLGIAPRNGIREADALLEQSVDGVYRPAADSPAAGAGITLPNLRLSATSPTDIGITRLESNAANGLVYKPLQPADVGPAWMMFE